MVYLIYVFLFLFGLCIGSFLNVVIYRLPRGLSIGKGRSFCPKCKKKLLWWELIPLFSFIFLKGRCSKCKVKISLQYPIVELTTGILFLLAFFRLTCGSGFMVRDLLPIIYVWTIISILIAIFFIDLKHYIIPDSLIIVGSALSLIYLLMFQFFDNLQPVFYNSKILIFFYRFLPISSFKFQVSSLFLNHILFAIIGGAFFGLIILFTKGRGMGIGDMKFGVLMGLILGSQLIMALYLSFVSGAIVGILLILLKKKSLKSKVPFGPFLVGVTLLFMIL